MEIPLFQLNAFTDRPFAGNPAAVRLLAQDAKITSTKALILCSFDV
jgi:predicted PhzF superfamily epimerase YddE/YHI9